MTVLAAAALPRAPSIGVGIATAAIAFALFTTMDTVVKWLSAGYPLHQIILFNSSFALLPVLLVAHHQGGLATLGTKRPLLHLARGLISIAGAFGAFYAYSRMPLADAYAILFASPLFITALSVPFLKEQVGWRRWLAVLVGFAGILIMLRPGSGVLSLGALGAIVGSMSYSCGVLLVRWAGRTESAVSFAFHTHGTIMLAGLALTPLGFVMPTAGDLTLFALAGLINGFATVMVTSAFRLAPAAVIAPFQYSQMLWGVLFGYVIWRDVPDVTILIGGAVVIASGLYILHRETVRSVPAVAPAAGTLAPKQPG